MRTLDKVEKRMLPLTEKGLSFVSKTYQSHPDLTKKVSKILTAGQDFKTTKQNYDQLCKKGIAFALQKYPDLMK
ncbi:hypothetical protein PX52LOC_06434 [Limnoglobus roseus]|uniref:Uncharacterized protein n=1 Tax=Limnoglobus roseus TaxID=2598579 RepID=A0A5C1AMM9_9BACT|nr:hypothetical protein PX52LOC_06434 [Limnoglobus roseus]